MSASRLVISASLSLCFTTHALSASLCNNKTLQRKDGLYIVSKETPNKFVRQKLSKVGDYYQTNRKIAYDRDLRIVLVGNNNNFLGLKSISSSDNAVLLKAFSKGGKKREVSYISAYRAKVKTKCSGGMYVKSASDRYNFIPVSEYLAHHTGRKSDKFLRENFHFKIYSNGKKCVSTDEEIDKINRPVAKFFNVRGLRQIAALPNLYKTSTAIAENNSNIKKTISNEFSGVSATLVYTPKGTVGCVEMFAPIPTWEPDRHWTQIFYTEGQLAYDEAINWQPISTDLIIGGVKTRISSKIRIRWKSN